jgi:hypothetical protein
MDTKLKNFCINVLRKASFKWKPRAEAKKRYRVPNGKFKNGKTKYGYQCAMCEEIFMSKDVKMDHIDPAVPLEGWQGFDVYIERMFCDEDGFQCLCGPCHDEKTNEEREIRKKNKKKT